MDKIYLNELSLKGQFEEINDFLDAAIPMMKCLKFIQKNHGQVYKHSTFYKQKITKDFLWNDLRGVYNDKARRLKSLLLSTTDNPPFWDMQETFAQDLDSEYIVGEEDVTATSVAEAAEENGLLLSFLCDEYQNTSVKIVKNKVEFLEVKSAYSLDYLSEQLWENGEIELYEYLCAKYEGTRLDFSKMERKYGFQDFEKEELRDCLQTFNKFIKMETWEQIFQDQGLRYKKYSPESQDKNWFKGEKYAGKVIDKFRCVNPKRCFGYRENDIFYVLRMERNHKISDYG